VTFSLYIQYQQSVRFQPEEGGGGGICDSAIDDIEKTQRVQIAFQVFILNANLMDF
jgi:hypothetical protein